MKKHTQNYNQEILFFPFAGGAGEIYASWFNHFNKQIKCEAYNLPGRGRRFHEQAFDNINSLIEEVAEYVLNKMSPPFYFFGHSMGALIAFELSRTLYFQHQICPKSIFFSGHRAPMLPNKRSLLHKKNSEDLFSELVAMGGLPSDGSIVMADIEIFLPTLYSDFKLCETYEYKNFGPLPCQINVMWGESDATIQAEHLDLWQKESLQPVNYYKMEGDHFYIRENFQNIISFIEKAVEENYLYESS